MKNRFRTLSNKGFTLLEIIIAMGVATVMMLGTMSLISISNKAVRNLTVSIDWNNQIAALSSFLADPSQCRSGLYGEILTFGGSLDYINPNKKNLSLRLPPRDPDYVQGTELVPIVRTVDFNPAFNVTKLQIVTVSGQTESSWVQKNNLCYRKFLAQLEIESTKSASINGEHLGSQTFILQNPIQFTIVTGPEKQQVAGQCADTNPDVVEGAFSPALGPGKDQIESCLGLGDVSTDAAMAACQASGGTFIEGPPATCMLPEHTGCSSYQSIPSTTEDLGASVTCKTNEQVMGGGGQCAAGTSLVESHVDVDGGVENKWIIKCSNYGAHRAYVTCCPREH